MQMEREWRNNGFVDFPAFDSPLTQSSSSSPLKLYSVASSPLPVSSSPAPAGSVSVGVGAGASNYIEHNVSRFDTLAGVAIKYGVEVSDIKKINNLVSDLQMFARKTLYIPLPGRHPPSPILTNESDAQRRTPPRRRHSDLFDSLQSLRLQSPKQQVSPAMHSLQGYYRLNRPDQNTSTEGSEMAVYHKGGSHYLEDGPFGKPSPCMNPPLSIHRKSKSVANGFKLENGVLGDDLSVPESDNSVSNLVRRRQKSEADFTRCAPEKLLKEDTSSNGFSITAGKGLALRPKAASRIISGAGSGANGETIGQNSVSTALGEFSLIDSLSGVKKSSSTSSLQDSESSSSLWSTVNWSLKSDLQALSTSAITRPIFDGLPKPITGRKNKTAVD